MSTDNSITVRFAAHSDLENCFKFDQSDRRDIIENKAEMYQIIVAERKGEIIGYLRLEYLWSKLPFIELILVSSEHRGRGIGRLMLNYLLDFLAANQYKVLLSSAQVNEAAPQRWHRKMGFEECGILNGINEDGVGEIFFRLNLES